MLADLAPRLSNETADVASPHVDGNCDATLSPLPINLRWTSCDPDIRQTPKWYLLAARGCYWNGCDGIAIAPILIGQSDSQRESELALEYIADPPGSDGLDDVKD